MQMCSWPRCTEVTEDWECELGWTCLCDDPEKPVFDTSRLLCPRHGEEFERRRAEMVARGDLPQN